MDVISYSLSPLASHNYTVGGRPSQPWCFLSILSIYFSAVTNHPCSSKPHSFQLLSTLQGPGCQGLVTTSILCNRSLTHFENRLQSCSFPTFLWKETHSLTLVNSVWVTTLGIRLQRWETALLLVKALFWYTTGDSYFCTHLCQCTFHPAHTFFQRLCLALTSSRGWCRLVPGWPSNSQGLTGFLEMNGTPSLCSFCRRKFYNHILHILPFPFIWRFN